MVSASTLDSRLLEKSTAAMPSGQMVSWRRSKASCSALYSGDGASNKLTDVESPSAIFVAMNLLLSLFGTRETGCCRKVAG